MATKQKTATLTTIETDSPELLTVKEQTTAIAGFVQRLAVFLHEAKVLHQTAQTTLMQAKAIPPPHDAGSDKIVQDMIRRNSAEKKAAETHWYEITSVATKFHKLLTGKRGATTDLHDQAQRILQPLHNGYVDREKQRVARENAAQALRDAQEARDRQQRVLDQLEADALKAEAQSPDLSEREQVFAAGVAVGRTIFDAAKSAGYKDPGVMGPRLMSTGKISKAIEALRSAAALRQQAAAVAEAPLDVIASPEILPDVTKGNGHDRSTWKVTTLDAEELRLAIFRAFAQAFSYAEGRDFNERVANALERTTIPARVLHVNPVVVNEFARSLEGNINRWPGVTAVKDTRTV